MFFVSRDQVFGFTQPGRLKNQVITAIVRNDMDPSGWLIDVGNLSDSEAKVPGFLGVNIEFVDQIALKFFEDRGRCHNLEFSPEGETYDFGGSARVSKAAHPHVGIKANFEHGLSSTFPNHAGDVFLFKPLPFGRLPGLFTNLFEDLIRGILTKGFPQDLADGPALLFRHFLNLFGHIRRQGDGYDL